MAVLATSSFSLPKNLVPGVWRKAQDGSVLARLSGAEPQEFGENEYMTLTGNPRAEVVAEGANKSESTATFAPVNAVQRKVQVTQRFNEEVQWADEARQLGVLRVMRDLTGEALGRALDLIAIHGINPLTGAALSGSPAKILDTTNAVELTTATLATPDQAIETAVGLVLSDGITPDGIAIDPTYSFSLATQRYEDGRKVAPDLGFGQSLGNYLGLNAAVGNTVSGGPEVVTASTGVYASDNPNIKAIVGDFSAFRWGVQVNIPMEVIRYGDPDGGGDLKRKNQIAIRAEVVYGIGIMSTDAFAKILDDTANS